MLVAVGFVILGFAALAAAVVLIICGFTIAPRVLNRGFLCLIVAVFLLIIGLLLPSLQRPGMDPYAASTVIITGPLP